MRTDKPRRERGSEATERSRHISKEVLHKGEDSSIVAFIFLRLEEINNNFLKGYY